VDELLFNCGELRLAVEAQAGKMRDAVEAEPEERVKQADVDAWAAALAHHFAVACPELQTKDVWREPVKDVKVDVSWDRSRYFSDPYRISRAISRATASSFTLPASSRSGQAASPTTRRVDG
jgi:hypothetical protein